MITINIILCLSAFNGVLFYIYRSSKTYESISYNASKMNWIARKILLECLLCGCFWLSVIELTLLSIFKQDFKILVYIFLLTALSIYVNKIIE